MSKRKCLLHANILKIDNPKHYFSKNKELYIIFFLSQDSCIKNVPSFTALLKKRVRRFRQKYFRFGNMGSGYPKVQITQLSQNESK